MEDHVTTEAWAPLRLGPLEIPGGLSFLATGRPSAVVKGLDAFRSRGLAVRRMVHPAFRLMVGLGDVVAWISVWALVLRIAKRPWHRLAAFLRAVLAAAPSGLLRDRSGVGGDRGRATAVGHLRRAPNERRGHADAESLGAVHGVLARLPGPCRDGGRHPARSGARDHPIRAPCLSARSARDSARDRSAGRRRLRHAGLARALRAPRRRRFRRRHLGFVRARPAGERAAHAHREGHRAGVGGEPRLAHSRHRPPLHGVSERLLRGRDGVACSLDAHGARHRATRVGLRVPPVRRRAASPLGPRVRGRQSGHAVLSRRGAGRDHRGQDPRRERRAHERVLRALDRAVLGGRRLSSRSPCSPTWPRFTSRTRRTTRHLRATFARVRSRPAWWCSW